MQEIKHLVSDPIRLTLALVIVTALLFIIWIGYLVIYDKPVDFYVYYLATKGFIRGEDVYGSAASDMWDRLARESNITNYAPPYRYPPLTAMMVLPLTFLNPRLAAGIWLAASAVAFMLSAYFLGATSRSAWGMPVSWGLALFFTPVLTTLHAGQVNGFVLLALSFSLYAWSRNRPVALGIGVALGAMLKLVPVAHLGYLGWRRQWLAFGIGVLSIVLLFAASIPLVGWTGLASYAKNFFTLGATGGLISPGANQAINGFVSRFLTASSDRWYWVDAPDLAQWLILISSSVLVLITIGLCLPIKSSSQTIVWEFALITIVVNLITPSAWYHQFVLLLIPFFVIIDFALSNQSFRWMLIPLGIGYGLTDLHGLIWHYIEPLPWITSTPFYTALMLWVFLAYLVARDKWNR